MAEPETPSYAARSATKQYRTSPLKGLWQHAPYFHDGSAATLEDVVRIYDTKRSLGLTPAQISDLVQYLKSL
jgi:cytochrome c peroxidase